jgi:diguanylate cyclase (GGDEF)-like protein/PAS domain S-box-containing protein
LLAVLVLALPLCTLASIAAWHGHNESAAHRALEKRTLAAAALDDARAHVLLSTLHIGAAAFFEDPTLFLDNYVAASGSVERDMTEARAIFESIGASEDLAAIDGILQHMGWLQGSVGFLSSFPSLPVSERMEVLRESYATVWPDVQSLTSSLNAFVEQQHEKLSEDRLAADRTSNVTLALLLTFSVSAFIAGSAAFVLLLFSVVRPIQVLKRDLQAISTDTPEASVTVSGPEEVASLGRHINEMVARRAKVEAALRESDERYRTLFERSLDAVYVHDFEGRFLDANDAALRLLGYSREEIAGLAFADLLDSSQLQVAIATTSELITTGRQRKPVTYRLKRKDGSFIEMETTAAVVHNNGRPAAIQGVARDISERRQAENALRESEAKYRHIFETVQDIFYRTDSHGIITEISPSVGRWGYKREDLIGTQVLDVYENPRQRSALLKALLQNGEVMDFEVRLKAADGEVFDSSVGSHLIYAPDGTMVGVEGFLRDIKERKQMERALREQMRRDALTGVLNHAAIVEELRRLVSRAGKSPCAVLMTDVDDLKAINDTFGHRVGDRVLLAVARCLSKTGAVVGRYGGDEFISIMPGADRDAAERYRRDVLRSLARTRIRDSKSGASIPVVISLGVAISPIEANRIEDLINLADGGMYETKRQRPLGVPAPDALDDLAARIVGQIVPLLTSPGELGEKLRLVARRLSVAGGYDGVSFILFPESDGAVVNTYARLPKKLVDQWDDAARRRGRDLLAARELLEEGRPVIIDDLQNDYRFGAKRRRLMGMAGLTSALAVPMVSRGALLGVLCVASKREGAFGPRDAQFLTAVAAQVTALVSMATLVEQLQAASQQLSRAHAETVLLLAAAAEAHDRTTGEHLQNVCRISEKIALELGWAKDNAAELGLAAVLHDIGKIRVTDSVLANHGKLTDEEWELMKRHAVWGEKFLAGRAGFELAATIARSHHERWDGEGYPDGLSGEEIPQAAAIVAVADSFDAMISDRPYRPRRSISSAMQEIVACSGQQFSPEVAEAMVRLYKRRSLYGLSRHQNEQAA